MRARVVVTGARVVVTGAYEGVKEHRADWGRRRSDGERSAGWGDGMETVTRGCWNDARVGGSTPRRAGCRAPTGALAATPHAVLACIAAWVLVGLAAPAEGPVRFMVLATQRTGSTLLGVLLNEHPDVLCLQEVFQFDTYNVSAPLLTASRANWTAHERVLELAYAGRVTRKRARTSVHDGGANKTEAAMAGSLAARGFKQMYNYIGHGIRDRFVDWASRHRLVVFHLHRNPLESYVSYRVAERTHVFQSVDVRKRYRQPVVPLPSRPHPTSTAPPRPLRANVTHVAHAVAATMEEFTYYRTRLAAAPGVTYYPVSYERHLRDPESREVLFGDLWRLLGVAPIVRTSFEPSTVPLRRLSSLPCAARYANWAAIRSALRPVFPEVVDECEHAV